MEMLKRNNAVNQMVELISLPIKCFISFMLMFCLRSISALISKLLIFILYSFLST